MKTAPAHAAHHGNHGNHGNHESETLEEFDAIVSARGTLAGFRIQYLDPTDRTRELLATDTVGAVLLGCRMRPDEADRFRTDGALALPPVPALPFGPYRGHLYTPGGLFAALDKGHAETPDALTYESHGDPTPMVLVNRAHRTERLPVRPLLRSLVRERSTEARIDLVDRTEEAPKALKRLSS
nr:hypothetical protein [Streptomyces hirsutus]